jgi:hypothetical protein
LQGVYPALGSSCRNQSITARNDENRLKKFLKNPISEECID